MPAPAAPRSSAACKTTIEGSPQAPTTCPLSSVPTMNAAEPVPRAHPYSNRAAEPRGRATASAMASASVVMGASAAAWNALIVNSSQKPDAGSRPSATSAASAVQITRTARSACVRSASRPHRGPEIRRTAVPAANRIPSCSGPRPRPSRNAGMNGDETPKAAYISAYRAMTRAGALIYRDGIAASWHRGCFPEGRGVNAIPGKETGMMPEKATVERAEEDKREGKAPSTQAGEFVREEMHHVREGKHGARSPEQAIAIGLSKARRAGVNLRAPKKGKASAKTRRDAKQALKRGRKGKKPSPARSRAAHAALEREGRSAASSAAVGRHARAAARRLGPRARAAAADKAVRTKGPRRRSAAARKAARTRARSGR